MASSRSEGKCLPQSFPTPNGVKVLDCPAILLGYVCFVLIGRCYCHYLFTKIWQMLLPLFVYQSLADVIAICFVVDIKPFVLFYRKEKLVYGSPIPPRTKLENQKIMQQIWGSGVLQRRSNNKKPPHGSQGQGSYNKQKWSHI